MLTVRSLGSGSSGNATLIDDGKTVVLVDSGVSHTSVVRGLASIHRSPDEVAAILLSHEHADHVRSLDRLVRKGVPVICTGGTARAAALSASQCERIALAESRALLSMTVTAIPLCHDAAEPCGYLVQTKEATVAVITDTGCATTELIDSLSNADLIVLEANHDEQMLRRGPYPAPLKRRVLSDVGHLSNRACAAMLAEVALGGEKRPTVWLAHLSAVNNRPDLAVATVVQRLTAGGRALQVEALPRISTSRLWRSDGDYAPTAMSGQLGLPGFD